MSDQPDEILTIDEVAAYLKAGKRTVYRLAANGKLTAFKLGGTWRFRRSDLAQVHGRLIFGQIFERSVNELVQTA